MRKAKAKKKKLKSIPVKTIDKIIGWAWDDKTSFDQIYKEFNLTEQEIIELMRMHLIPFIPINPSRIFLYAYRRPRSVCSAYQFNLADWYKAF